MSKRKFCEEKIKIDYAGHYNLIKLKCEWYSFKSYLHENPNLTISEGNNVYEIEFIRKSPYPLQAPINPYEINANLFKNYRIRNLTFHDLEIKAIQPGAFKSCCEKTLEYLDLSKNKLKRIDFGVLENLKALDYLNLGLNPELKLASENFKQNIHLRFVGLSSNNLGYLPEKLFSNLEMLEKIDLSNNSLKNLDACTFYPIYSMQNMNTKNKAGPLAIVNALENNIECNCDVFFLERSANIKLNLTCSGEPEYYNGKRLSDLSREDPSEVDCFYKPIQFNCKSKYENSNSLLKSYETFKVLVIVFSVLFSLCSCVSLCLCCRVRKLNSKMKEIEKLNGNSPQQQTTKGYSLVANTTNQEYKELQQTAE